MARKRLRGLALLRSSAQKVIAHNSINKGMSSSPTKDETRTIVVSSPTKDEKRSIAVSSSHSGSPTGVCEEYIFGQSNREYLQDQSHKDAHSSITKAAQLSVDAFAAYLRREFTTSSDMFQKVGELLAGEEGEPASALLLQRSKQFELSPPGEDWDGVEVLKEKTFSEIPKTMPLQKKKLSMDLGYSAGPLLKLTGAPTPANR
jgi:hypothetical protein